MSSQTKRKEVVARAWLMGEKSTVRVANYRAEAVRVGDDIVSALVSYGPHYVVSYPNPTGGYWVNTTAFAGQDYQDARQRAGWGSSVKGDVVRNGAGYAYTVPRTTAASPTTAAHVAACESVLRDEGYSPIPTRIENGPNGHAYRLWTDEYCYGCEEVVVSPGRVYCSADCKAEYGTLDYDLADYGPDASSDADPGL